jgi:hypothetical protein
MRKIMFHDEAPYHSFFGSDEYEQEESKGPSIPKAPKAEYKEQERPREITIERRTIHSMLKEKEMEPLKKIGPNVIGNLFDRVEFLKQRIDEVNNALETRNLLHQELTKEIDDDIMDKQSVLTGLSNIDDIRDFKLDISSLRMEKRRENVLFWRDIFDLNTQLRELMEQYQMEAKIASLFKELKPGG